MAKNTKLFVSKSILYAEDDANSRTQMTVLLDMLFGKVYTASDGEEAWKMYNEKDCNIVLTDIKMPRKDGLKLVESIRYKDRKTPVVLLSSFTDQEFLLKAANLSVDGYIVKPIDLDTLIDVVNTAFKRTKQEKSEIRLDKNLTYNQNKREVYYDDGEVIVLTAMELKLLDFLVRNQNITLTKEQIAEELWPLEPSCESAVKNIILRLRKKIGDHVILSAYGIGYKLELHQHK